MKDIHENMHIALVTFHEGGKYELSPWEPVWSPWLKTLEQWKEDVLANCRAHKVKGVFFCHMTDVFYLKDGASEMFLEAVKDYPEVRGYALTHSE